MKLILITVAVALTGCVHDAVISDFDAICNATTKTKDQYRECMYAHYQRLKSSAAAARDLL